SVARVVVTHPEIASVSEEKDGLHVHARSAGTTTLLVWDKAHNRVAFTVNVKGGSRGSSGSEAVREETVEVGTGELRTIELLQPVKRIAVGDPEIADVKVDGDSRLLVSGQSEGKTTVLVWLKDDTRVSYLAVVRQSASRQQFTLKVGEHRDMSDVIKGPVSRVAIGNPAIVEMVPKEHWAMELAGKAEGHTTFIVWPNEGPRVEYDVVVTR
ncbi:MAG: pilus assembly protein N-terminal domain-containing protein, partial [Myxococcaceae bacterium]